MERGAVEDRGGLESDAHGSCFSRYCCCCGESAGSGAAARTPEELAELCDNSEDDDDDASGGGGGGGGGGRLRGVSAMESLERRDAWPSALQAEHEDSDEMAADEEDDDDDEDGGDGPDAAGARLTKARPLSSRARRRGAAGGRRRHRACLTQLAQGLAFLLLGVAVATCALLLVWGPARLAWALPASALDAALPWSRERGALAVLLLLGAAVRGALALGAALAVAAAPGAAGSGAEEEAVPWLLRDGVRDPTVWSRGAVAVRGLGAACSAAGGLAVGIEAPMLHVGTALGLWLPSLLCPALSRGGLRPAALCTARGRRCLAAAGSAAGMSVAFGAPLAGAAFGLQNAGPGALADPGLAFLLLLSSLTASLVFSALASAAAALGGGGGGGARSWPVGALDLPGLAAGDAGRSPAGSAEPWALLLAAAALGAVGGLHAAGHRRLHARLTRYRARHVFPKPPCAGAVEALLVSLAGSCAAFLAAAALGSCVPPTGGGGGNATAPRRDPRALLPSLLCPNGTDNDLARLLLSAPEAALGGLLGPGAPASPRSLLLALGCAAPLALWAAGLRAPGGVFAPLLLVGAVYGRLAAWLLRRWQPRRWPAPRQGELALAGAAAVLGGAVRWPLVLALALAEASGADAEATAAALLALLLSGWLAGACGPREPARAAAALRGVPLLPAGPAEPLPPPAPAWQRCLRQLLACDVMEPELVYVYPHTRVQSLVSVLRARRHHAFPVVTEAAGAGYGGAGNAALLAANGAFHRAALGVTRAHEYQRRSRSMRSYPSAELQLALAAGRPGTERRRHGGDDDEGDAAGESSPACEYLASVLRPAAEPYPSLQPGWAAGAGEAGAAVAAADRAADAGLPGEWTLAQRLRPLTYHGMVSRSRLAALLARGAWYEEGQAPARQPRVGAAALAEAERRGLDVGDLELALLEPRAVVDVTPYADAGAPAVSARASAGEALRVMTALQARQLAVLNAAGHVVGVVTRHELTPEALRRSLRRKRMARP